MTGGGLVLRWLLRVHRRLPAQVTGLVPRSVRDHLGRRLRGASPTPAADARRRAMADAQAASRAHDWPRAIALWSRVIDSYGDDAPAVAHARLARAYRAAGDLAAAEEAIDAGLRQHSEDVAITAERAELAMAQRDWPMAAEHWTRVLDTAEQPAPAKVLRKSARSYRRMGRFDEAESVLRRGMAAHPDEVGLAADHAELATAKRDWAEAAIRWEDVIRNFGDRAPVAAYLNACRSYVDQGALDAAQDVLARGRRAQPGSPELAAEQVGIAPMIPDGDATGSVLADVLRDHGDTFRPRHYVAMAQRLLTAFEHDAADRAVEAGLARYPGDPDLLRQHLRNAIDRERRTIDPETWTWTEARRRSAHALAVLTAPDERDYLDHARDLADATAHDAALDLLREGIDRWPASRVLRAERAILAMARGDGAAAAAIWTALLDDADGDEAHALRLNLSRAHRSLQDYDAARAVLDVHGGDPRIASRTRLEAASIELERRDYHAAAGLLEPLVASHGNAPSNGPPLQAFRLHRLALHLAGRPAPGGTTPPGLEANPGVVAIIGGGPSLEGVDLTPLRGQVHCVGVNATYLALPWVDQTVTHDRSHLRERYADAAGAVLAAVPASYLETLGQLPHLALHRGIVADRLSELDGILHIGGHTSAYTALNYAYLLRPRKIILFGIDLTGFWGPDESWHRQTDPYNRRRFETMARRPSFDRFVAYRSRKLANAAAVFASALPQLHRAGIEVVNASPDSSVTCFRRVSPHAGIAEALAPAHPVAA